MDSNDIEPHEIRRSFGMAAGATGGSWRAQLYVTFMIWRRVRQARQPSADDRQTSCLPDANLSHKRLTDACHPPTGMATARTDGPSEGPWDDTRRRPRPIRAMVLLAALLLIAWLTADAAVRLLAHIDLARLASGS